jgi:hypothetical protein
MSNTWDDSFVKPSAFLHDDFEISIADGLVCPSCTTPIRRFDAEALHPRGMRIVCRECGLDLLYYEPALR